ILREIDEREAQEREAQAAAAAAERAPPARAQRTQIGGRESREGHAAAGTERKLRRATPSRAADDWRSSPPRRCALPRSRTSTLRGASSASSVASGPRSPAVPRRP